MNGLSRTYLYAPADNERLLAKVLDRGADAVVLDLEDGVAADRKAAARDALVGFLAEVERSDPAPRPALLVRINRAGDGWDLDDVAAATCPVVDSISLPKAEHPQAVAQVAAALGEDHAIGLHLIVESALGVQRVEDLARCDRVVRFGLGAADLVADLGLDIRSADHPALDFVRGRMVVASRAAGLLPPVDAVHLAVDDPTGLRRSAERARSFGFFGKSVVHPTQVEVVNDVFTPTSDQVERARRIEAANRQHQGGVLMLDGQLVDPPVVLRALRVLELARRLEATTTSKEGVPT